MYPRTEYEMTNDDLKALLDSCKPVPVIMVGGYTPSSPQENANRAWKRLGEKMGFDYETVRPIAGKGQRFFSAIPSETEDQRKERLAIEENERRTAEIEKIEAEINRLTDRLKELKA